MLNLEEIKKQYNGNLHKFSRGLLREYLQYLILDIIFSNSISEKLTFLGGTCLRIVYGINRFSEDLDFDNKNLSKEDFLSLTYYIQKTLSEYGYSVEIKVITKKAFHCHIKFSNILFENDISNIKSEIINIQIDTSDQKYAYEPELYILNKFNIFKQIRVAPKSIILAQKLWTITQRNRSKGRDYYDIIELFKSCTPDMGFLQFKFQLTQKKDIKSKILDDIQYVDLKQMVKDVNPFLINSNESEKILLFREYLEQEF
jgi:predicted nucleotidyltransferase component of viral defense system